MKSRDDGGFGARLSIGALVVVTVLFSWTGESSAVANAVRLDPFGEPVDALPVEFLDAEPAEVTFYARKHDVSIERSIEINTWMAAAQDIVQSFSRGHPDLCAGLTLYHGDTTDGLASGALRFEVYLVDRSPEVADTLQETLPTARDIDVEVLSDPQFIPIAEQLRIGDAAFAVRPDGLVPDVGIDGEVTYVDGGEGVLDSSCPPSTQMGGWLEGGRQVEIRQPTACTTWGACTSGFTAWYDPGAPGRHNLSRNLDRRPLLRRPRYRNERR